MEGCFEVEDQVIHGKDQILQICTELIQTNQWFEVEPLLNGEGNRWIVTTKREKTIDTSNISGLDSLRHLFRENNLTTINLAQLLDINTDEAAKILLGHISLTVEHLHKLADRFKVKPELFV